MSGSLGTTRGIVKNGSTIGKPKEWIFTGDSTRQDDYGRCRIHLPAA